MFVPDFFKKSFSHISSLPLSILKYFPITKVISKTHIMFNGPPLADRFGLKAERTLVREHFKSNRNAASGHNMRF
jgi:hypothetical protein